MRIKLLSLVLQCRGGQEVLDFSPQVTFFHGKMSAGKSSIARLIDYCLGAKDLERTTAISKELVSVELTAQIETYAVIFERTAESGGSVQVSWTDKDNVERTILAPLQESERATPLVGDDVFTFSDLMFHLFCKPPLRVRRSTLDEESPMVRLSFRDIFWYCYLEQTKLDNSFFRLEDPFRRTKSRYAIRYILGYYTERLEELQGQLTKATNDRTGNLAAARQFRDFLGELGYVSEDDIRADIVEVGRQLEGAKRHQRELQTSFHANTHFADALRKRLRGMSDALGNEEQAFDDLRVRLREFEALRSELITAKQKLSRSAAASTVLAGVLFESCPQCGTKVNPKPPTDPACGLCGNTPPGSGEDRATNIQVAKRDLDSRIRELDDTVNRARSSVKRQQQAVESLRREKQGLDLQLAEELKRYDSLFLTENREADRRTATLEERLRGLERLQKLPDAIQRLEREADRLLAEQERLRRAIQAEQTSLTSANTLVTELEGTYLAVLLAVGVPGVNHGDRVEINRRTWVPAILEGGDDAQRWDFYTAGSNGKKTLLNVCYAIAVHLVAETHNRPLPTLLMIDHPMKCTSPDVNRDVFESFYRYLYGLVRGPLSGTQVILIDNDFFPADGPDITLVERYMTPDDDAHPPLISYYRGA